MRRILCRLGVHPWRRYRLVTLTDAAPLDGVTLCHCAGCGRPLRRRPVE